jgi:16S rRNA (uracil1498-N3)-methyltransferase
MKSGHLFSFQNKVLSVRRFFISEDELKQDEVTLTGDEFHHLKNVSRLESGEYVELLDGAGNLARAQITSLDKRQAVLKIEGRESIPLPPYPHVEIILCVPRFQKMDMIIQKSVELGAQKLTVVTSDRSFLKGVSDDLLNKLPRWKKIATEACKQSGRAWPLKFGEISTLETTMQDAEGTNSLFLYEGQGTKDIKTALTELPHDIKDVKVFIGAEGGFSPGEVAKFSSLGLKPVTMGALVLRVETACIAILSVIEYHFGHLR